MIQAKLFDRVQITKDNPQQNVVAGMTGTLMELGEDGTWGVIELDDDAISQTGKYCVFMELSDIEVLQEAIAA